MAVIAPNSEIYLIKCPLELDNLNQLSFASATAQHNYFNGLPKLSLTNATFQRKDGTIRWPGSMESILEYNYCMYRNKSHGNKWFYAFIDNMSYVSDNMTSIKISTDVWQTWQFDINWKECYVEREHTNDDTVGANTIPEGLDTGEYICNDVVDYVFANPETVTDAASAAEYMVCIQVTTLKLTNNDYFDGPTYNILNSVPQGCYVLAWPLSKYTAGNMWGICGAYDSNGKGDAIISAFIVPKEISSTWTAYTGHGILANLSSSVYYPADTHGGTIMHGKQNGASANSMTVAINTTIDGYTPKNNKCKVAPYNYFSVTNNNGTDLEFYYEDFRGTPEFYLTGCFEQGASVMLYPANSKKTSTTAVSYAGTGWTEGLSGGKNPTLSWQSDYYLNWQAKNGTNVAIQTGLQAAGFALNVLNPLGSSAISHATDIDTAVERGYFPDEQRMSVNAGGMAGSVINFASSVANTQNTIRNAKMVPPQAKGNASTGNLAFSAGYAGKFTARKMSCKAEYIRCIDNYFSMLGYKTNRVKLPNISGRTNWNYVKTQGCNITGDMPQGDLQQIKAMFNNGVTIWHNATTFMDYSQSNNII